MFYIGGIALAFFLNLLLLSKSKKTTADKVLALWLLVITIHLMFFYFWKAKLFPELLGLQLPIPLLHGPLLFLYTVSLTKGGLPRMWSLHFVPFLAEIIYLIPFFMLPAAHKVFVFENEGVGYETFNLINSFAVMTSGVVYVIMSIIALTRHRRLILQVFSSTDKINLQWLQYLIYWIGLIWIFVIFGNDDWIFAAAVLFVVFIGFFGIRQVGIFSTSSNRLATTHAEDNLFSTAVPLEPSSPETSEKRKYKKSGLTMDHSEILHRSLSFIMSKEKLYRDSELSLAALANRLDTQPNYLSQVINEREGKNFYDYVNTIRIEEFKRLAANPESRKFTLLALAQECGFNSKSSFNRYCKKVTGKSPSDFIQTVPDAVN